MIEMEDIPITKEEYVAMVKTINQLRKEKHHLIDKACKWLRASTILADTTIERFKQALTEIEDENEDEKIRKKLILYFKDLKGGWFQDISHESIIAWLEKQGEKEQDPCEHCNDKCLNCLNFPCVDKREFERGKSAMEAIHEEKVDNAIKVEQKPYGQKEECFNCQFNYAGHCKGYCELKKQAPKPKWSEEDEGMMNHCIGAIHIAGCHVTNSYTAKDKKAMKDWLKSLKQKIGE